MIEYALIRLPLRFRSKVVTVEGGCWEWQAARSQGYGKYVQRTSRPKKYVGAHRFSYEFFVGPIPEGLQIDHLCRNRACVNPAHLEPVTNQENSRRGAKGRLVTVCAQGHHYDEANTGYKKSGRRYCRACAKEAMRRKREAGYIAPSRRKVAAW